MGYNCGCFLWAKKQHNWRTLITFLTLPTFFDFVILKSTMILISIQRTYCTLYVCTGTVLYVLYVARATYLHYIAKVWPINRPVYAGMPVLLARFIFHVFLCSRFNHLYRTYGMFQSTTKKSKIHVGPYSYFLGRKSSGVSTGSPVFYAYFESTILFFICVQISWKLKIQVIIRNSFRKCRGLPIGVFSYIFTKTITYEVIIHNYYFCYNSMIPEGFIHDYYRGMARINIVGLPCMWKEFE